LKNTLVVVTILSLILLLGCAKKLDWSNTDTLIQQTLNSGAFSEPLNKISQKYGFEYYTLNSENYKDAIFYFSSGATAEEFVYLRAQDEQSFNDAIKAAEMRIAEQSISFSYYIPGEVSKLDNAKIFRDNKKLIVIICVANDYDKLPL